MAQQINDLDKRFAAITWDAGLSATCYNPFYHKLLVITS